MKYFDEETVKRLLENSIYHTLEDCPFIEIPDEHGRLVDFDAFIKSYDYGMFPNMTKEQLEYWINESIDDAKIVLEASK